MAIILVILIIVISVGIGLYSWYLQYRVDIVIPNNISPKGIRIGATIWPESWMGPGNANFSSLRIFNDKLYIWIDVLNKYKFSFSDVKEVAIKNLGLKKNVLVINCNDGLGLLCMLSKKNERELLKFLSSKNVNLTQSAKEFLEK